MEFQSFLRNYAETTTGYWNTHKIIIDPTGNIEVEEGTSTNEENKEIFKVFEEQIALISKNSETDFSLLDHVISLSTHLENDLKIKFTNIVTQHFPIKIKASDGPLELNFNEYKHLEKTPLFRKAFRGSFNEATSREIPFPSFTKKEIKNYLNFALNKKYFDEKTDRFDVLISTYIFSDYLQDATTSNCCEEAIYGKLKTTNNLNELLDRSLKLLNIPQFSHKQEQILRILLLYARVHLLRKPAIEVELFFDKLSLALGKELCNNVKTIDLSYLLLTKNLFHKLGQLFPSIETLILIGCDDTTDEDLKNLALNCPNLRDIKISGCQDITAIGIEALATSCPKLESIVAKPVDVITQNDWKQLKLKFPNLGIYN